MTFEQIFNILNEISDDDLDNLDENIIILKHHRDYVPVHNLAHDFTKLH